MQKTEPSKYLLQIAEKIIEQNDKIIKMNTMITEAITKPQMIIGPEDLVKSHNQFADIKEE